MKAKCALGAICFGFALCALGDTLPEHGAPPERADARTPATAPTALNPPPQDTTTLSGSGSVIVDTVVILAILGLMGVSCVALILAVLHPEALKDLYDDMVATVRHARGARTHPGGGSGTAKPETGGRRGRTSTVGTERIRMTLDTETGAVEGVVLIALHANVALDTLSRGALLALLVAWRDDTPSRRLLESWMDQAHPGWREEEGQRPSSTTMSAQEARAILEVSGEASPDDIVQARRRLMMRAHPDRGGTQWYAAKLNEARDVLLAESATRQGGARQDGPERRQRQYAPEDTDRDR